MEDSDHDLSVCGAIAQWSSMTIKKRKTTNHMKTITETSCKTWCHGAIVLVILDLRSAQASFTSDTDEVSRRYKGTRWTKWGPWPCNVNSCARGQGKCNRAIEGDGDMVTYCVCQAEYTGIRCDQKHKKDINTRCARGPEHLNNTLCPEDGIKQGDTFVVNCSANSISSPNTIIDGRKDNQITEGILMERVQLKRGPASESLAIFRPRMCWGCPLEHWNTSRKEGLENNYTMFVVFFGNEIRGSMNAGISMTIIGATCADQVEYTCEFEYSMLNNSYIATTAYSVTPKIEDCPAPPTTPPPACAHDSASVEAMNDPIVCLLAMAMTGLIILI